MERVFSLAMLLIISTIGVHAAPCLTADRVTISDFSISPGNWFRIYLSASVATSCACTDTAGSKYARLQSGGIFSESTIAVVTNAALTGMPLKLKISDAGDPSCDVLEIMSWD